MGNGIGRELPRTVKLPRAGSEDAWQLAVSRRCGFVRTGNEFFWMNFFLPEALVSLGEHACQDVIGNALGPQLTLKLHALDVHPREKI